MNTTHEVSVLFARSDSIYKKLGVDVWDIERDARLWPGGNPVVAHPPCRAWGKFKAFANPRPDEKDLAFFAIEQVRKWGGVLEHPQGSSLWPQYLPLPGFRDEWGGYTISVDQFWWGHRALKRTYLYICGVEQNRLPEIPLRFDAVTHVIGGASKRKNGERPKNKKPEITKKEREATPVGLAKWLIKTAALCEIPSTLKNNK